MSLTFEIKGALPEHAIRHIIREAESRMADGADAKAALVQVAQDYFAEQHAIDIKAALDAAKEMADMIGGDVDLDATLADVKAQVGAEFETAMNAYAGGPVQHLADALAKAAVNAKPVMPMNRGKWLAKLGIVKAHIDALGTGSTASTPPGPPEWRDTPPPPADDDADLAAMLGLDVPEVPAPPPFVAGSAAGVVPPPQMSADVPSAAPPGPDAPPPPVGASPRDAFVLFGEAMEVDDAALAKRLGVSRSTIHNYLNGKTAKVKVTLAQARTMVAEIDVRVAKLRQAADIFAQVRD